MIKKKIYISFIALLISYTIYGQSVISLDSINGDADYSIEVLADSNYLYKFKVIIHKIKDKTVLKNNIIFHRLSFDDYSFNSTIGYPELPSVNQLLAIPEDTEKDIIITDSIWTNVNIGTIYPTQQSIQGYQKDTAFVFNDSVYQSYSYTPNIIQVSDNMYWRNIKNAVLSLCPFRYQPISGVLSVMKEFTVTVNFRTNTQANDAKFSSELDDWHLFANHAGFKNNSSRLIQPLCTDFTGEQYNYLIILGDSLNMYDNQALKDFIKWKAFKGYKTKVTTTQTTGTTLNSIWHYIKSEHDNYDIKYVLLVGDETSIPLATAPQTFNIYKGDYCYGCLDNMFNDVEADVPIGRFPTNVINEMENMINKTIRYESNYSYANDALLVIPLCQGSDPFQECMNEIADTEYATPIDFIIADGNSVSNGGNNATNAFLTGTINNLTNIVHYFGHGSESLWNWIWNASYESFGSSNIVDLNDNSLSLFWTIACNTGNIEANNNILETFMKENYGAVIYLGATAESFQDPNSAYCKNIYKKMLNDNVVNMGDLNVATHVKGITDNVNCAFYNAFMYILGGDPSLEIWTSSPQKINNIFLENLNDSINIITDQNGPYRLSIISENGVLLKQIDNVYGTYSIQIPNENIYIVVNKHNFFPYVIECNITSNYIQNQTITDDVYYFNTPVLIGYDVNPNSQLGDVKVEDGGKLHLKLGQNGVTLKNGITIEKGATLEIK